MRLDLYRGGVACFNFSYSDSHLDLLTFKETIVTNTKTTRCILLSYLHEQKTTLLPGGTFLQQPLFTKN